MGFFTIILGIIFFFIIRIGPSSWITKKPNNNTFHQNFFYNQQRDFQNRGNRKSPFGGDNNAKPSNQTISGQPKQRTSNVDKNEGEYVDFEEIE